MNRVFLLSPANAGGERARIILAERSEFDVAIRLREGVATIGELFTFVSGLYFRGKMAYSTAFADPPDGLPHALVITPNRGLLPVDTPVDTVQFREMASVPVDLAEERYRAPLVRDARALRQAAGNDCVFILLGSIATPKYTDPLLAEFDERLLFPATFAGRGDMSRGGLMLRSAREGVELEYVPVRDAVRHGPRPPKLPRIR